MVNMVYLPVGVPPNYGSANLFGLRHPGDWARLLLDGRLSWVAEGGQGSQSSVLLPFHRVDLNDHDAVRRRYPSPIGIGGKIMTEFSVSAKERQGLSVQGLSVQEKATIESVYDEIAGEYDERIPGSGPSDEIFTETELEFLLSKITKGERILDMGCGTGRFTVPLAAAGAEVTGLDLSTGMLSVAGKKLAERGLQAEMRQGDMAALPFPDGIFDTVTSMLALMHIPLADRQAVFSEVSRVLKPGGRMLLCVKNSVFERLFRGDRFASVDVTDVEAKKLIFTETASGSDYTAPWYSFAPHDLTALFARAGMTVTHLRGNSPVSAWLADEVLADIRTVVQRLERALSDVPPFSYLGYHLLVEAVKPLG